MILDSSDESSGYIEDCEVCCRPIELVFRFEGDELQRFDARQMDGI